MADDASARERYFPAIETKYGEPVAVWFERLSALGDTARYPDQMALLQQSYAMSRTHANALVMTHRGSTHARRFANLEEYLASLTDPQKQQINTLIAIITATFTDLQLLIAYNQPMFTQNGTYVVGLSASSKHVSLNPFHETVVASFASQFPANMVTTHTLKWALDTPIDDTLVIAIVTAAKTQAASS